MAEQKKSRKHGRNAQWCNHYRLEATREWNKARRLVRHLRRFIGDKIAVAALNKCKAALSVGKLRQLSKLEAAPSKSAA